MGGDHKLERADPIVQCEVQAHNSTALEINLHVGPVIFHMVQYARYFDGKRRFSAISRSQQSISSVRRDRRPAAGEKGTQRARFRAKGTPARRGQGATAPPKRRISNLPIGGLKKGLRAAVDRAHCAVRAKNLDSEEFGPS